MGVAAPLSCPTMTGLNYRGACAFLALRPAKPLASRPQPVVGLPEVYIAKQCLKAGLKSAPIDRDSKA